MSSPSLGGQVGYLAGRSVVRTLRQPAYVVPPLLFPLALLAVNSAGLSASTRLPGFPAHSFLPFALAVPFMQGALFATMNAGTDLARDIQTGFLNRLSLTPMRAPALIAGHLAGVVTMGFIQACFYLAVGLIAGAGLAAGPAGAVVLLLLATLICAGFGALGAFMALRTGSGEAIQGLFPLLFVGLFISSMNAPRHLMSVTWFRDAATGNPVSYLLEGVRSLIIEGWNAQALALAFTVATILFMASVAASALALRSRMTRT
jgi:ABC-2 type transport system permease protein